MFLAARVSSKTCEEVISKPVAQAIWLMQGTNELKGNDQAEPFRSWDLNTQPSEA